MFGSSVTVTAVKLELFVSTCFPKLNTFAKEQRVGNKQEMLISMLRVYIARYCFSHKREILPPILDINFKYMCKETSTNFLSAHIP